MTFLRRRRWALAIVVLQLVLFWMVATSEHYRWMTTKREWYKVQPLPDSERFGHLLLEKHPVKPQPPPSQDDIMDEQWGDNYPDTAGVIAVKLLDFPVVIVMYASCLVLKPYFEQVAFFYAGTSVGIALYWYLIGVVIDRFIQRTRAHRQAS